MSVARIAVVLVAGCWSPEPRAPVAPPQPAPAPAPPVTKDVGVETPAEEPVTVGSPMPVGPDQAHEDPALSDRLRKGELGKLIRGPVVVLDLDAGTFTTFCDALAGRLAHDVSLKLMDPTRQPPTCVTFPAVDRTRCSQLSIHGQQMDRVVVELDDHPPRHLRSVVVGNNHANVSLEKALPARAAAATCP